MEYKQIRAVYDETTIRVYQAYSHKIANEALRLGKFGGNFKLTRMTWIKPSFLWMMYRCGWAIKDAGQNRVLAIDIKRSAFDELVRNAVSSHYYKELGITREEWQTQLKNSNIVCQWDPERDIYGNKMEYRSLQIGIRGEASYKYVNNWIVQINDITEYVAELRELKSIDKDLVYAKLPAEKIYPMSNSISLFS
ncbi:hypothetical protein AN639_03540 [Candidatus Epulonipiscium fishelsonii]|uniref:Uncharacterized protein n=2 Tax=Candidatus Epulonipiscium fishelsonii TaxID=77094 RepID=A0ACC8XA56_9FIRM|nr:hypothetical protein AN396_09135 [Epulopiscium sp. SCG-B11WGA-EpuloA1]ONI41531.1 hypothetical protein AN639_03540 [Epulopiscium sp. SCG-B05WGA-EpuloA1]ONI41923.1 hypothetical protein AN396_02685 [Epulopiscium sp. SCG-B11WGA-EpuloA1]